MLREFELQQAWSNYWYFRPSRKSFDTAQMPFGCTGFGFQQSNKADRMDLQPGLVGAQQAIAKVVRNNLVEQNHLANISWVHERSSLEVQQIVRCPEGPGVEDDVLMKTAMNCSRSRWRQLRNHFTNQVTICLQRCWKKGPGLLWCHPGMSSSIETGFDNAFHWMIVSSPFISICDFCPRRQ